MSSKKVWVGRVSEGRDPITGKQRLHWIGRYKTKRERDDAVARARIEKPWETKAQGPMCEDWAIRYLERYAQRNKHSSTATAIHCLKPFRRDFGSRPLDSITHVEAEDWAQRVPKGVLPRVIALFNYAMQMRVVDHNPFGGLGGQRTSR